MRARAAGLALLLATGAAWFGASWVSLPSAAETPAPTVSATPSPSPSVRIVAERGDRCGTVRVRIVGSTPVELWRAETATPTDGMDVGPGLWQRQPRDAQDRTDAVAGPWVVYQGLDRDLATVYSDPVLVESCTPQSPPAGVTPAPSPTVSPTPPAGVSTPDREGGLASTGADR